MQRNKIKDTPRANSLENQIVKISQDYYQGLGNMELSQKELDAIIYKLITDEDLVAVVENIIDELRTAKKIL